MKSDLPYPHFIILVLVFFIAVNLFILDLKVFYPGGMLFSEAARQNNQTVAPSVPTLNAPILQNQFSCPAACLDIISKSVSDSRPGNTQGTAPVRGLSPIIQTVTPKEYYIPLGSGSVSQSNWTDLVSTETVINPSVYGNFREAYFLASLKNPTQNGQAEVRIYNVTDNNVVYGSHMVMSGITEQTLTSQSFALPRTSKLYRLQLKSTLSYPVSLENARLKIIAQ